MDIFICRDRNDLDVSAVYHQLLDTYKSSDTESEAETESKPGPSSGRRSAKPETRGRRHREQRTCSKRISTTAASPPDWKHECRDLLEMLWSCEDSTPFRYRTYHAVFSLSTCNHT